MIQSETIWTATSMEYRKSLHEFHLNGLKFIQPFPHKRFNQISTRLRSMLHTELFSSHLLFLPMHSDSQLIWPSWQTFTTVNLRKSELLDYIRKIFSKKFQNSPKYDSPWIIYGIQGVDVSYVSWQKMHFFIIYFAQTFTCVQQIFFYAIVFVVVFS